MKFIFLVVFIFLSTTAVAADSKQSIPEIENLIKIIGDKYSVNTGLTTKKLQINGGVYLIAFLYFEGFNRGNNYYTYTAVYSRNYDLEADSTMESYRLLDARLTGGKGLRIVHSDEVNVSGNTVSIKTTEYKKNKAGMIEEAMCCPSQQGKLDIIVKGNVVSYTN